MGVAQRFEVPPNNVSVFLVAHHCHEVQLLLTRSTGGFPYFLKVRIGDRDVTKHFDTEQLLLEAIELEPEGVGCHPMVASSAVKNILAILNDSGLLTHSPGPNGLVGGYDIRLSATGAEVVLPENLTLEEAKAINEEAQKGDGIDKIEPDGTVVYTDTAYDIMKTLIGYDCKRLLPSESDERARELRDLYARFQQKYV